MIGGVQALTENLDVRIGPFAVTAFLIIEQVSEAVRTKCRGLKLEIHSLQFD